ncbi:MAG: hypothetical protein ABSC46_00960 [Candidatus Limnocylindrales bacterium]|jgi:hypothetical protein
MDDREGERNEPGETPGEAGQLDTSADAPPVVGNWRPRRLPLAGALIVATLVAAGAFIAIGPVRIGVGPQSCPPAATPVPGGLPRECAIELARAYQTNAGALVSVRSGRYGDLKAVNWSQAVDPSRLVWVVEFVAPPICVWGPPTPPGSGSPAPAACFSYGPGISTVVMDLATGEFIFSGAAYN